VISFWRPSRRRPTCRKRSGRPLPEEPLAIFNAALEEGARLDAIFVKLGREHHPMTLPTLISVAEIDDLRLIVLHHTFLRVFGDPPERPGKN